MHIKPNFTPPPHIRALIVSLFLVLPLSAAKAEGELLPTVTSFTKADYGADSQNWAIAESTPGEILVGNHRGLLVFDGYTWECKRLPGGQPVRALEVLGDRIYVGGYHEFGYWQRNNCGVLEYTSLAEAFSGQSMKNDEIWHIAAWGDKILFQAFHAWYIYDGTDVRMVRSVPLMQSLHVTNSGQVLVTVQGQGLAVAQPEEGSFTFQEGVPFQSPVVAVLPTDGFSWVVTSDDGLFRWDGATFTSVRTQADALLRESSPTCAVLDPITGYLVVGTHANGILVFSTDGTFRFHLDGENILPGDIIHSMNYDSVGNLWLAMGNGLSLIQMNVPIRHLPALYPQVGDIYASAYQAPYLYLGTSQGLFRGRISEDFSRMTDLRKVPEIRGHVLDLFSVDGQLFCGTNGETYEIFPDRMSQTWWASGGAAMDKGRINGQDVLVQGTYSSLCVYLRKNGRWVFSHEVEGFSQPVRSLRIDNFGTIWAAHLHGGLFAVRLSDDLHSVSKQRHFASLDGSADTHPVQVCRFKDYVVFTDGESGFYTYSGLEDRLRIFHQLDQFSSIENIVPTDTNHYLFLSHTGSVFVHAPSADSLSVLARIPSSRMGGIPVDGTPKVFILSSGLFLFPLENALAIYDSNHHPSQAVHPQLYLSQVKAVDYEKQVEQILSLTQQRPRLSWRFRNVEVSFRFVGRSFDVSPRFRYRVKGLGDSWHSVQGAPRVLLDYLPSGHFNLEFEALSADGTTLSALSYPFYIKPPFYRSLPAYVLYVFLGLLAVALVFWFMRKKMILQTALQEKERLQEEVKQKVKELTLYTWNASHHNESLIRIRDIVTEKKLRLGKDFPDKDYRQVIAVIEDQLASGGDWNLFVANFNMLYENFFTTLKARCSDLTENDLRICAYIRMNVSSKEIANLLNVTLKGVEAARTRVRKKLMLPADQSLSSYLMSI